MVAGWGFAFGIIPVTWTTWITTAVPDETESAGGLQVAAIQLAIALGAGVGGVLLDATGPRGAFAGSGVILFLAAGTVRLGLSTGPSRRATGPAPEPERDAVTPVHCPTGN